MAAAPPSRLVLAASHGVRLLDRSAPAGRFTAGSARILQYGDQAGRARRMWVYTPPGYNGADTFPVTYLLHRQGHPVLNRLLVGHGAATLDALIGEGWTRPCIVAAPLGVVGEPPAWRPAPDDDGLPCMHSLLEHAVPFLQRTHPVAASDSLSIAVVSGKSEDATDFDVFLDPDEMTSLTLEHARFYRRLFWWTRQFRARHELRLVGVSVRERRLPTSDHSSPRGTFYRCFATVMPLLN